MGRFKDFFNAFWYLKVSRRCFVADIGSKSGFTVSHSHRREKRCFYVNLHNVSLMSEALGRAIRVRVSSRGLRTIESGGIGIDNYLLSVPPSSLPRDMRMLRNKIYKLLSESKKSNDKKVEQTTSKTQTDSKSKKEDSTVKKVADAKNDKDKEEVEVEGDVKKVEEKSSVCKQSDSDMKNKVAK